MARDPDEDALSWGDERDATHAAETSNAPRVTDAARDADSARPAQMPPDERTEPDVSAPDDDLDRAFGNARTTEPEDVDSADGAEGQLGSVALVLLGIIGGVYLLYALGWLGAVLRDGTPYGDEQLVQRVFYQLGQVLAVAAAPLWFAATIYLTRRALLRRGLPWLIVGLIVLAPWPFLVAV